MKRIFKRWINVGEAVLDMICIQLPSPIEAQKTRIDRIYNKYSEEIKEEEGEEEKK